MIRRLTTLLALGLVATTAACAARTSTAPATPPSSATASSPATPSPSSPSCSAQVVAGDSANNTTVCVTLGSDLTVLLRAPSADGGWSTPEVTGGALGGPQPLPTPFGSVGWSFRALTAGTADITTSRNICPPGPPGTMRCRGLIAYHLHVEVR